MSLADSISGILINIFSNFLDDKMKNSAYDRRLKKFIRDLKTWVYDFCNKHDSTIVTTNAFNMFVVHNKIIDSIFNYILDNANYNIAEKFFLQDIINSLKAYLKLQNIEIKPQDYSICVSFFNEVFGKIKGFMFEESNNLISYCSSQNSISLTKIEAKMNDQTITLSKIMELIKEIVENPKAIGNILCESNIESYKTMINMYVSNIYLYAKNNYDKSYFNKTFDYIELNFKKTWKQGILEDFEQMRPEINKSSHKHDIESKINLIQNHNRQYDFIDQTIRMILNNNEWDDHTKSLLEDILYDNFNKIILISGEPGSGKTHFVKEYLLYVLKNNCKNKFVIPIEYYGLIRFAPADIASFEIYLVNKINYFFNSKFNSLAELEESIENIQDFQITFILDDIQKIHIYNNLLFYNILNFVKQLTQYDFLNWIFTVNEFELYIFDNKKNSFIIRNYCVNFKQYDGIFEYTFNLNLYNQQNSIGNKIIESYGITQYTVPLPKQDFFQPLNNPLYSHIMGIKYSGEEILPYFSTYLDFITTLRKIIETKFDEEYHDEFNTIKNHIDAIIEKVLTNNKIIFSNNEIDKISSLSILMGSHLIKIKEKNNDVFSPYYLSNIYELYTTIYWAFKIVLYEEKNENKDSIIIYNRIKDIEKLNDEIIPCYLLYLDYYKRYDDCKILFESIMDNHNINYALFCSPKASLDYKKNLYNLLIANTNFDLNRAEAFALLYYLHFYNAKAIEKFEIISKYSDAISKNELYYNLELIVKNLLNSSVKLTNFKRNIKPFFYCTNREINIIVGKMCGHKYYNLVKVEDLEKQINDLYAYLESNLDVLKNTHKELFVDFFMRSYITDLIYQLDSTKIYEVLQKHKCLFGNKLLGILFRKNFACAAGNIYFFNANNKNICDSYVNVIGEIMSSKEEKDYIFAFHLISNSVENSKDETQFIRAELRDFLKKIWDDPKLLKFNTEDYEMRLFFERNLNIFMVP